MSAEVVVPASNMAALDSLDVEAREVAITGMLDQARTWLAHAVESTAPAQDIANFKAFVATAAETSKRLKVSKEIQTDAEVMVRRSERALGQAIRAGQERGEIGVKGQRRDRPGQDRVTNTILTDIVDGSEWRGNAAGIVHLTDDVTDEEFEDALDRAKAEGNVSRANTVRKVEEVKSGAERQAEKWERIAALAAEGHTSHQVAEIIGANASAVRDGARKRGIDFPADRAVGKRQRLNADRILSGVAESVAGAAYSLQQVNPLDLDQDAAQEWVDSLTESINALRKAVRSIKESIS